MEPRPVGRRVRGLLAGAATGLLTLAGLTAGSTAAAAEPAYTETEIERVIPLTVLTENPCTGEPVVIQGPPVRAVPSHFQGDTRHHQ
jgi:hypothetical protein